MIKTATSKVAGHIRSVQHRHISNQDWQTKPGSFDALNTSRLFESDNLLGIPALLHTPLSAIPDWLVAYRARVRSPQFHFTRAAVHFFLDDYRFETVWARPLRALEHLSKYRILLTPDFSLYADWPLVMQQWNVYRSRWCGRYWQQLGYHVVPTISWSTPQSFAFCFEGLPRNSLIAVSALGVNSDEPVQRERFTAGFREMIERIAPSAVLAYGNLPDETYKLARIITFPMSWDRRVHAHRREAA